MSATLQPLANEEIYLETDDGTMIPLDVRAWSAEADEVEVRRLAQLCGPVIDIGCGPGRLVVALAERGVPALGVDASPSAVSQAVDRRASALVRSVFDPLPGTGRWASALLFDGNVGIGGDSIALLARVGELLAPEGRAVVEVKAPGIATRSYAARLHRGSEHSEWFGWAEVGADGVEPVAQAAGGRLLDVTADGGRWFAEITWGHPMTTSTPRALANQVSEAIPDVSKRYASPLHDTKVAAVLGTALGVAFGICFATGLISHFIQYPVSWFQWPARPAGLYRVTQGLHVATGIASIPLVVAKLWVVAPRFWARPMVRSAAHGLERLLLLPLVGGSIFLVVTGTINTFKWYPWLFFPRAHYWAAWIMIGGLIAHIGSKAGLSYRALRSGDTSGSELEDRATSSDRRWFLGGVGLGAGALTVATVGQTFGPLRGVSVLAPRDPGSGSQGLPVNRSARSARVTEEKAEAWTLRVFGRVDQELELTLEEVQQLPQYDTELPIACVEGWSKSAEWRGVRLRDVLELAGAEEGRPIFLQSLQERSLYRNSVVPANIAADKDTLLALELNGEPLNLDHGYPCRLISPNRPGVLQTKWVNRVRVD